MVEELSPSKIADLKWINSNWPKTRQHINPRSETGDSPDDFDIWGLSKIHVDEQNNIYVSGGVQIWCYWPDFTFRTHIILEAGEVSFLGFKTLGG